MGLKYHSDRGRKGESIKLYVEQIRRGWWWWDAWGRKFSTISEELSMILNITHSMSAHIDMYKWNGQKCIFERWIMKWCMVKGIKCNF